MKALNEIREKIKKLYETNPRVCVSVNTTHPKVILENKEVTIKGVYPNIFRLEEATEAAVCHTVTYGDVLTGHVKIKELEN